MNLFIKVGSITNAQRAQRVLSSMGYKPQMRRIENPTDTDGCGYAIMVNAKGDEPLKILKKNGIKVRGVEYR